MKCIYVRTNLVNGKQYVGQTNDMKKRDYQWYNTDNVYAGTYITNARNKYGTENFKTEILKECDTQEELNQWEQYYIKELNTKVPNGYNLTDGGYGISGYEFTEEHKRNLSEAKKGKHYPKLSETLKGKHNSVNTEIKKGEHRSPKTEFKKGDISLRRKIVYQYTLEGKFVKEWESATEAAKSGFLRNCVTQCCLSMKKTHKGYIWSYTKKEDVN